MNTLAVTPAVSRRSFRKSLPVNEQAAAKTLAQLIGDVQAGRLYAAQTQLTSLMQQLGSHAASEAASPLGKLLTQLGGNLAWGNLGGASASVGSFLKALSSGSVTQ